jgi:hypothetical protein
MFKDDNYLESVFARYKLGLDRLQAHQFGGPMPFRPSWRDRLLFKLGSKLIVLGSRLQERHDNSTPAGYHPVYPIG